MLKTAVSLLVTSPTLSLAELTARLGRVPAAESHDKGDAHAVSGKLPWPITVWRFDSDAPESASVQDHLERLERRFPPADLQRTLPSGCTLSVDVALFFESAFVSATIAPRGIEIINCYDAKLEITCYPVS